MAKVITFSRTFPSYHPRKGEPTYFIEKIYASLADTLSGFKIPNDANKYWDWYEYYNCRSPKHHTIRAGHRFKAGDWFSPRVWSGKPYRSKQIVFAPDIQVKKVWSVGIRIRGDFKEFYSEDCDLTNTSIGHLAVNDGLSTEDLFSWFTRPFEGQIICWNENINY